MSHACETCSLAEVLTQMGVDTTKSDYVIGLAGNPNTGKSTVFNALTGLKQHTGNWPGKTVTRAEGSFKFGDHTYKMVDLPGTYSLLSASVDEEVARDFILFARPDCTIVVVDATALERNLNLVLQILEITDRVVVCLNLIDEAERKGIQVDVRGLATELGVPVVPAAARYNQGLGDLLGTVDDVIQRRVDTHPRRVRLSGPLEAALEDLSGELGRLLPDLACPRWVAMRLLDGDYAVRQSLRDGDMGTSIESAERSDLLERADRLQRTLGEGFRDDLVADLYHEAERIKKKTVSQKGEGRIKFEEKVDRIVTSPIWGLPIMFLGLAVIFWLTIAGSNVPSQLLAKGFFWFEGVAAGFFTSIGVPAWITGLLWHGTYRGLAWVVSVMLPPMAIFFPMFTILEDLGYLPRVAFNVDRFFKAAGAHGKQVLSMGMGLGCNAAGVIATRVIDSPRERLIAILTNNFVPCNGRFPTLIMLATIFVGARFSPALASAAAAGSVVFVVLIGVVVTLVVSAVLSRTMLKGEPSSFTLELPPYRRPNIRQILYTSLIDRTLFVLWRAVVMAAPAGALIWVLAAIHIGDKSLTMWAAGFLQPLGNAIGLDGVILLAYIIALPANEIVVPAILMAYTGAGQLMDIQNMGQLQGLLVDQQGWTMLTAVSLMLFSVLHNPCSTTILTIWKETRSRKWTAVGTFLPLGIAFAATFLVASIWRLVA